MGTAIFVHGTGVRQADYEASFKKVAAAFAQFPDLELKPCYWGHLGSDLSAGGASIPRYDSTRALENGVTTTDEDYSVALWGVLYCDPLYELRVLALRQETTAAWVPGQLAPGGELASMGKVFPLTPELSRLLEIGGIAGTFEEARQAVTDSPHYLAALENAPAALAEYRAVLARAFIAQAAALVEQKADADDESNQTQVTYAEIKYDAALRDQTEKLLFEALGGTEYSLGGWVKEQFKGLALQMGSRYGTWQGTRNRGAVMDAAYPAAGDILLYQGRGQQIRQFIKQCIVEAAPPRIVIAHSLGGIACVDLLVAAARGQAGIAPAELKGLVDDDLLMAEPLEVELLVTAGSQAPFFYEINALQSLPYGHALPSQFPRWLNLYDLRDFLSYKGWKIFDGKVRDIRVDNRQPFPASHSAYWSNPAVWQAVAEELR